MLQTPFISSKPCQFAPGTRVYRDWSRDEDWVLHPDGAGLIGPGGESGIVQPDGTVMVTTHAAFKHYTPSPPRPDDPEAVYMSASGGSFQGGRYHAPGVAPQASRKPKSALTPEEGRIFQHINYARYDTADASNDYRGRMSAEDWQVLQRLCRSSAESCSCCW